MCLKEEPVHHLVVHCHWAALVWHLALFAMGISWVKPFKAKNVGGLEKDENELSLKSLEYGSYAYLEGKDLTFF